MRGLSLVVCLGFATSSRAAPECELRGAPWLESATGTRVVDARVGDVVQVFVAAPALVDGRAVVLGDSRVGGRVPFARCQGASFVWRRVEPRMEHDKTPAPSADTKIYTNAVIFGPHHGQWIGFDALESIETLLPGGGSSLVVRDAQASAAINTIDRGERRTLGNMRLAATVRLGDEERSTAADLERAFRYTFRDGDDFLGWLWTWFNVPYLFGSAGKGKKAQAERYYGADCADVMVGALRRTGVDVEYTSVAGLVDKLHRASGIAVLDRCDVQRATVAAPCKTTGLAWGRDVRAGDLIALDYIGVDELPRAWDHIVAAVADSGPDGKPDGLLGPEDLVADSGDRLGLKVSPLGEQGHVRLVVLRPSRK